MRGRQAPEFPRLLAAAGIRLALAFPNRAWLGSGLVVRGGGLVMTGTPTLDSPLYRAGIDRGDRVLDIGGEAISSSQELGAFLQDREAGEVLSVRFESRGQPYETLLTLGADPTLAGELEASTDAERDFLRRWKAGARLEKLVLQLWSMRRIKYCASLYIKIMQDGYSVNHAG